MRKVKISRLREIAKIRPAGYMEECLAAGRIEGDRIVFDDDEKYADLLVKYRGAGDVFAKFVGKPIAHAIDAVLGTDISHCGGCAERQEALNKAIPFKG
jgi:hypothetical protein